MNDIFGCFPITWHVPLSDLGTAHWSFRCPADDQQPPGCACRSSCCGPHQGHPENGWIVKHGDGLKQNRLFFLSFSCPALIGYLCCCIYSFKHIHGWPFVVSSLTWLKMSPSRTLQVEKVSVKEPREGKRASKGIWDSKEKSIVKYGDMEMLCHVLHH